ncbi:MAG: hypothetical protein QNK37_10130 [Acidobacteriota bacterium]|nr:hypothetical protein [Acidobacteriota bacterium]
MRNYRNGIQFLGLLLVSSLTLQGFTDEEYSPARLQEILDKEGFKEAVDYAEDAEAEYMRAQLFGILLKKAQTAKHLRILVDQVDELEADHRRAELMEGILNHRAADEKVRRDVIDELDKIENQARRTKLLGMIARYEEEKNLDELLKAVKDLENGSFAAELYGKIIRAHSAELLMKADVLDNLEDLNGEHFRFDLVRKLLDKDDLTSRHVREIVEEAADILGSDHFKAELLLPLVERYREEETLAEVIETAEEIAGATTRAAVLVKAAQVSPPSKSMTVRILSATEDIDSESQACLVVKTLIEKDSQDQENVSVIIERLPDMVRSDYNRGGLMIRALRHAEVDKAFFDTLDSLDSQHEKTKVLMRLLDRKDLNEEQLEKIIEAATALSSDGAKFKILHALAMKHELPVSLELAFEEAVAGLGKEHYRQEIERALDH